MPEYHNNLRKVSYASGGKRQKFMNSYATFEKQEAFNKRNSRYAYAANKSKTYPKVQGGKLQNNDWFRSKVYQR